MNDKIDPQKLTETQAWPEPLDVMRKVFQDAEFPGSAGFSARNVWDMRRLFLAYTGADILAQVVRDFPRNAKNRSLRQPVAEISVIGGGSGQNATMIQFLRQLVAEIPWGQNLIILNKISHHLRPLGRPPPRHPRP